MRRVHGGRILVMTLLAAAALTACAAPAPPVSAAPASAPTPPTSPAAASSEPPAPAPRPPPVVPPDAPAHLRPFLAAGCVPLPTNRERVLDCREAPAIRAMGCMLDVLFLRPEDTGFRFPTAECQRDPRARARAEHPDDGPPGIVSFGCMFPIFRRYVVARPEGLTLARTTAQLAAAVGPIETEPAALAFASAVTRGQPLDAMPPRSVPGALRFEPTRVDRTGDGFDVRLFDTRYCGCGPHPTAAIVVRVTRDGTVTTRAEGTVYDDGNRACVD